MEHTSNRGKVLRIALAASLVGAITLPSIPAYADGPEIRLNPVAGTGNVICTPGEGACGETQIILSAGGVIVTLFVEVSGWDTDQDGDPTLGALQAVIDHQTLYGSSPSGVETLGGFDLEPVGSHVGMGFQGIFQALEVCTDTYSTPDMTDPITKLSFCGTGYISPPPDCPPSHPICLERPDYLFYGLDNTAGVSTHHAGSWYAESPECVLDPDGGATKFYVGTLLLDVPLGAVGTYNVNQIDDPNFTSLWSCADVLIHRTMTPAQVTILPGAVDCNANGIPDENEADDDNDSVINACDGCPNDPNKIEPGVCGCGGDDNLDADGDDVPDCVDQCPGVDDVVFAPDCVGQIPTLSAWGAVAMTLLLLAASKVNSTRRTSRL